MKYFGMMILAASTAYGEGAAPSIAPSFDCAKAATAVEKAICASEDLSKLDTEMTKILTDFKKLNADMKVLEAEQVRWAQSKEACVQADLEFCLADLYHARLSVLSPPEPEIYFEDQNGKNMLVYRLKDKFAENTYVISSIDEKILNEPDLRAIVSNQQAAIENAGNGIIGLVNTNFNQWLSLHFMDSRLVSMEKSVSEYSGGAHGSWDVWAFIYDRHKTGEIKFSDLFNPADTAKVKILLDKHVMGAVKKANHQMNIDSGDMSTEDEADFINYWPDLEQNIAESKLEDWNSIGLEASEDKLVDRFNVFASAYEYASYAASGGFADMKLDVKPFLPFIKPEYRDSFIK